MQNQQKARYKKSKMEEEMNKTVIRMVTFHVLICIVLSAACYIWVDTYGKFTHYLDMYVFEESEDTYIDEVLDTDIVEIKKDPQRKSNANIAV